MIRLRWFLVWFTAIAAGQSFTQRGYLESGTFLYPQDALNDGGHAVSEALLRYEAFATLAGGLRFSAGVDARTDTHRQDERELHWYWFDRSRQRPAVAVRRFSATYTKGRFTADLGKQFIRWGKADVLSPTDRFAPRDFLNVVQTELLAVTGARVTYGSQSNSVDLVWVPRFTPSRTPLLNQRWVVLPEGIPFRDLGARYPGGSQFGARFNHIGQKAEYSLSFYDGNNHLPLFDAAVQTAPVEVGFTRFYPQMRMYGGDAAVPLRHFTVKGEAAYFTSSDKRADEYMLYVVQLERQAGEWFFVGGYAGEVVTQKRMAAGFAPDRGLTRAFLGRAGYNIDANRSVALETAVRQNGDGLWLRLEYSQAFGNHWRATAGATLIRGAADDFLGQYDRNSHISVVLRYSF